ncbi:MAG: hypothetical protein ABI560_11400 [Myxococcales bacterium]
MTISSRPRAFITLSFALALGMVACGSSSGNGAGGNNGSSGGASGSLGGMTGSQGGSTGTTGSGGSLGGGGATGACANVPPCLANLATSCMPSGTCVQQTTTNATTGSSSINSCYSNGVKEAFTTMINIATMSATFLGTVSKSGSTCFTESADLPLTGAGDNTTFTIKNAAGATVATITVNSTTDTQTLTCGGQTYDITNLGDCGMPMGTTPSDNCTDGACP